jgi:hypothetical protein
LLLVAVLSDKVTISICNNVGVLMVIDILMQYTSYHPRPADESAG